jgi:DNA-binding transcriptional LysR family regulator
VASGLLAAPVRQSMEKFFADHRFEPRITMELGSNETIKQAVMAGMDVSLLSLHTIGLELRSDLLRVLDVEGAALMRGWHLVHLQSKVLSPAAEAFRYFVLARGQAYLQQHDVGLLSVQR